MVLINIDKQYEVPTQLNEIDLRTFIRLQDYLYDNDYDSAIKLITGVPNDVYDKIDNEGKLRMAEIVKLLLNGEPIFGDKLDLYELMDCPIGQFEDWKSTIAEFKDKEWHVLPYLCLLEKGDYDYNKRSNKRYLEYLDMPSSIALFHQKKVNEQFEELKNKFLPLFENEYEDIQLEAGVMSLNQFGGYGTLVHLANNVYKDIEVVSKTSVGEAYMFLTYKKIEKTYTNNLEKLMYEKANRDIQK